MPTSIPTEKPSATMASPLPYLEFQRFNLKPLANLERWVWGFIFLGIAARSLRFLLCVPLWPDEAYLAASYLDHSYLEMLTKPLAFHQVAPPGYLWIQLTIVKLLGFNEYSLRLFSLITGIAGLFVFRHLASRLTSGIAYLFCVAMYAVAYPAVRYSAEAKPYGCDLFVGMVLAALYVEWYQRGRSLKWLGILAAASCSLLWFSLPSVFVSGGLSLAVGWSLFHHRDWKHVPAYLVWNVLFLGSFVGLQLALRQMATADLQGMRECWERAFPPLDNPLHTLHWFVYMLTGEVAPFPVGSMRGGSSGTVLCCLIAVVCLWSNRRVDLAILFLAPLGLNLVAAGMQRYPFGGGVRFTLYSGTAFCFLTGLGAACIAAWFTKRFPSRKVVLTMLVGLTLIGGGTMVRDFFRPYKTRDILRTRGFAQWFWFNKAYDAELVCLKTDLNLDFSPSTFEGSVSSLYLCNQKIYSQRHKAGQPPDLTRVSADHPLRCAMFRDARWDFNQQGFDAWLARMQESYELLAHEQYPFQVLHKDKEFKHNCYVDLYEFVPKPQAAQGRKIRTAFDAPGVH
ncbi:hypothetical protein CA54_11590 [Symmachiella macrocystis]|uniref:Uncharacterized protein n=1 Tax=Symmachiella macrocystis TaxID=2527985 RepID=A0A5C6BM19_9PLAN|nr:glycosyltransferase family 39 protein [Symmachiella macrocystis]TWU12336.1 hypothetical protein CA54_11590 [Symmachiella macrocystis]